MDELSYMLTQYFVSSVHVRFYFSLALIYTLLAAPCWPLAFLIFLPLLIIKINANKPVPLYKGDTGYRRPGLGKCDLKKARHMYMSPKAFVHHCSLVTSVTLPLQECRNIRYSPT